VNAPTERHLSTELIQSYLDGEASGEDASRVREHTGSCARCRSEMEAWQTLFTGLEGLEEVAPAPGFQGRVLARLAPLPPERLGIAAKLAARLGARWGASPSREVTGHVGADRLQDFLEGLVPRPEALAVEGHLHACRGCREEAEEWRGLLAGIGQLPSFAPSDDFSERVMAHVRVQLALASARPTLKERLQLVARSISPETRKRVAALAGAALTPAVTLALVAYTVFSHPLVTLGNLLSFLWLEGSGWVGGWSSALAQRVTGNEVAVRALGMLEAVAGSPATAALSATGLGALTLVAVWVLYRNVIATDQVEGHYAR
jgi:anti-sigma factor RsiW